MQKKKTYAELLKDPRWQKKRLEIMQRDKFTCQYCGATDKELQVHHRVYRKNAAPWEYDRSELMTLCKRCHEGETEANSELYKSYLELKQTFIDLGFSMELLQSIISTIGYTLEDYVYEKEKDCHFNIVLKYIYEISCGVQNIQDANVLENTFGVDMSEFFKVVYPNYKRNDRRIEENG